MQQVYFIGSSILQVTFILELLKGYLDIEYGIKFNWISQLKLIGFCDNDWHRYVDDMKSTLGYVFFFFFFFYLGLGAFTVFEEESISGWIIYRSWICCDWFRYSTSYLVMKNYEGCRWRARKSYNIFLVIVNQLWKWQGIQFFIVEPNTLHLNIISFVKQLSCVHGVNRVG